MQTRQSTVKSELDVCESPDSEALFNETLKVLGDFWVLRIVSALETSPQRFCELERTLGNSNPVTLTKKLKKLEESGYVIRRTESLDKQSVNYSLTDKGHATLPVVAAIKQFSVSYS